MTRWLPLLLVGCSYDEQAFFEDYYEELCERTRECAGATAEDVSACRTGVTQNASVQVDYYESLGCTYVEQSARECTADIRALDCDAYLSMEFGPSCAESYDCPE